MVVDRASFPLVSAASPNGPAPTTPWATLEAMREIPVDQRLPLYEEWKLQVAMCPPHEQDALLSAGRELFKYRMETARKDLRASSLTLHGPTQKQLCVATEEFLAEGAYRLTPEPTMGFLTHKWANPDDPAEWSTTVSMGKQTFTTPPQMNLVCFPSEAAPYGDEADLELALRQFLDSYIQFEDPDFRELLIAYIFYTWISDRIPIAPYLRMLGDFSSGKTTALRVAWPLVRRGIFAAGAATAAPLFRIVHAYRGTLILDEADFDQRDEEWKQILKILLTGHTEGPGVLRAERGADSDAFDVKEYDAFGPKMLATRRPFSDAALESRCLTTTMQLVPNLAPHIPLFQDEEFRQRAADLRNCLLQWRFTHYPSVTVNPRERIPGTEPRLNAIALALLAAVPPEDTRRREALVRRIKAYSDAMKERRRESPEGFVAEAIVTKWEAAQRPARLQLSHVSEEVRRDLDSGITVEKLGNIVRALGFQTYRSRGFSWIRTGPEYIYSLVRRYGLELKGRHPVMAPSSPPGDTPA